MWFTKRSLFAPRASVRGALVFALILQGCASSYKGPEPDFSLTGNAAKLEADKFTLQPSHSLVRGPWYDMGPTQARFSIRSLEPMINKISMDASETLERAATIRRLQYGVLSLAAILGVIALGSVDNASSRAVTTGAVLLGATGLGLGFHYDSLLSQGASEFNRDLKRSFTPALTWNWRF